MANTLSSRYYQKALLVLRHNHEEEFHQILAQLYIDESVDVKKRRSRQQVLNDQITAAKKLLIENNVE